MVSSKRCNRRRNLPHNHQLGRLPTRQAQLRTMPFADADVLDESEDLAVPRDRRSDIGHRQHGSHARVGRRSVDKHPATLERHGQRSQSPRRPVRQRTR